MELPQEIFEKLNIEPTDKEESNLFEAFAAKNYHFKASENKLNNSPETIFEYFAFMKFYQRIVALPWKDDKYQNRQEEIKEYLPFTFDFRTYKNSKIENLPIDWAKNNFYDDERIGDVIVKSFKIKRDRKNIEKLSGIYLSSENFQSYINKLPKYSFGIWAKIKLNSPYYSADDDPFYPINPVMKERNFKVPMVRGSSWKGALSSAFKRMINERMKNEELTIENFGKLIMSFIRIFGVGSDEYRKITNELEKEQDKINNEKLANAVVSFLLFELGVDKLNANYEEIKYNPIQFLKEKINEHYQTKLKEKQLEAPYLFPHKGRLIIYPTYFDRLSLEVINPHDRLRRAGTQPIYYEVVPPGATGILQMVYIPYDGVLTEYDKLREQVEIDLKNILEALKELKSAGIGAKNKLGWGQFQFGDFDENHKFSVFQDKDLEQKITFKNW